MNRLYRYERAEVFPSPAIPLSVRVSPQTLCVPHEHDFIEIVLAVSGTGQQETAHRRIPIKPGTVTILRPGHWHSYKQCRKLVIYNCCFGPELLRRELAWLIDDPKLAPLLWGTSQTHVGSAPSVFNLGVAPVRRLQHILDCLRRNDSASYGVKVSWLCLFLSKLASELPAHPSPLADHEKMHPAVIKAIHLVEDDLRSPWTIRGLAGKCGLSPEYLIRLFKIGVGMTPYAYINRCRAERAASLLLRSSTTIGEIGEQIGWGEPCHFARRFKRQFGMAATAYRSRMGLRR